MNPVLVDTSVWVVHFRRGSGEVRRLLRADLMLTHPWVVAEIACGTPPPRQTTIGDLGDLRMSQTASLGETMAFVERERLFGLGFGLVDLVLLASVLITPGARLWTFDKALARLAARLGVAHACEAD